MNDVTDDNTKDCTAQLVTDKDIYIYIFKYTLLLWMLQTNYKQIYKWTFQKRIEKVISERKRLQHTLFWQFEWEYVHCQIYRAKGKKITWFRRFDHCWYYVCLRWEKWKVHSEKTCVGILVNTDFPAYFKISVCPDKRSFFFDELIFKNTNFVSSKQLLESVIKGLLSDLKTNTKFVIAGPSVMILQENYKDTSLDFESIDQVFAFRCFSSRIVKYWLSREQKSNKWPPRHIIESVITEGCLLVPKGQPLSDEFDLMWRVSFSEIEVMLAKTLTREERQCYLVAKYLIKDLEKCVISSYHIKTVFFSMSFLVTCLLVKVFC